MELTRLIELLVARQSDQARLESDRGVQIWTPDGWKEGNAPIPSQQIVRMISLVAPAHVRALIHDLNAHYHFDYSHPNSNYRVEVEVIAGRRRVWVTRLDESSQPLRSGNEGLHDLSFDVPVSVSTASASNGFDAMNVPAPPAPKSGDGAHWFYAHAGQSLGPHSFEEMSSLAKSGALLRETMVFDSRVGDWQQAKFSALGPYFPFERTPEWVNPATQNWQPPSQGDIQSEKFLVRAVSVGGVGLVVFLVGWVALSQMRNSNRAFDYSEQAAVAAIGLSPQTTQGQLHNIHLSHSRENPALYYGTGQYSNNYLADVEVEIKKRDFWAHPGVWELTETPHDFTSELQSLIMSRTNNNLVAADSDARVVRVTLSQDQGTHFSGTVYFNDRTAYPVTAEILEYDSDGNLLRWSHHIQID